MKKIITALVAVAVMSIGLTACGDDDEECEGAGGSSGVGVMSMTDGKSGGSTGGSSGGGGRGGTTGSRQGSNSKPGSVGVTVGIGLADDDDCDED